MDALLAWIDLLCDFPERGTPRPDIEVGLRTRVFRRSVTIAYAFSDGTVTVVGVFARGRDVNARAVGVVD